MIAVSDFSFAERAVIDVWVWLWFIQRVWTTDKFACLQWSKIRNFDLKSIITLLIFLMLPVQATFDIIWTYLKYNEGYIIDPLTNAIITKPTFYILGNKIIPLWSADDRLLKEITEYVLAFGFAFQIGTLALMQAFWSHLSSQMGGKPFMRSWKFRFYVGWVFASMIIFPLARILTRNSFILVETIPQLFFSTQLFVLFLLGIKNGRKLNNLLKSIQQTTSPSGQETILRIHYFIEMNKSLMLGTLLISVGMIIITIDTIAFKQSIRSKFLLDLLIIHVNFGSLILWATMILIVYPRYYITGTSGAVLNSTTTTTLKGCRHSSLETGNVPKNTSPNSFVVNLSSTTTTMTTTFQPSRTTVKGLQFNDKIEQSINSLLEEQNQQIETFRHKASTSISSTATLITTSHPTSPLIPPPPSFPPPASAYENSLRDIER